MNMKGGREHLTYGSFTRIRPCIETKTWSREDRAGFQFSFPSPSHVPRRDKHTLPSSYKLLKTQEYVLVQIRRKTHGFTRNVMKGFCGQRSVWGVKYKYTIYLVHFRWSNSKNKRWADDWGKSSRVSSQ